MFIGREREMRELVRRYDSDAFEMPVVYGRRRVGKTRLITRFIEGRRAIYVQARRTNAQTNLGILSQAILGFSTGMSAGSFSTFDEAFDAVGELARDERLVLVIDEFPYLAQSFPEISSLLQEKVDHRYKDGSKLMLILCGSSMSFMEEQVLGYESPLYGRRTAQIKLQPLDFFTTRGFWEGVSAKDAALLYGCTGGIPAYAEKIDPAQTVRENIERLFFSPDGFLFEEPGNLLLQECRSPAQYDAIVQAIASGKSRVSEIAATTKIPESNTRMYLGKLMTLNIVRRETPFGEESAKRAVYSLADHLFMFWYRFVSRHVGLIENGLGHTVFDNIEPQINAYMGRVFEDICLQYVYREAAKGDLGILPVSVGRWWGNDPRTRSQEEIDLVIGDDAGAMMLGECKWRNEPTGADVLKTLIRRSDLFHCERKRYLVFSKSDFTGGCRELAEERGDVSLVPFEEMTD